MTEAEFREFSRQLLLRQERAEREFRAVIARHTASIDANIAMSREIQAESREIMSELRAHRGALLATIDRLGPGPAAA